MVSSICCYKLLHCAAMEKYWKVKEHPFLKAGHNCALLLAIVKQAYRVSFPGCSNGLGMKLVATLFCLAVQRSRMRVASQLRVEDGGYVLPFGLQSLGEQRVYESP